MTKKIYVTKAQQTAARMIVDRSAKSGKTVRSSVSRIADASGRTSGAKSAPETPK